MSAFPPSIAGFLSHGPTVFQEVCGWLRASPYFVWAERKTHAKISYERRHLPTETRDSGGLNVFKTAIVADESGKYGRHTRNNHA